MHNKFEGLHFIVVLFASSLNILKLGLVSQVVEQTNHKLVFNHSLQLHLHFAIFKKNNTTTRKKHENTMNTDDNDNILSVTMTEFTREAGTRDKYRKTG